MNLKRYLNVTYRGYHPVGIVTCAIAGVLVYALATLVISGKVQMADVRNAIVVGFVVSFMLDYVGRHSYYVSRITAYMIVGGGSTFAVAPVVAESRDIQHLFLGIVVGFVLGLLFETRNRRKAQRNG